MQHDVVLLSHGRVDILVIGSPHFRLMDGCFRDGTTDEVLISMRKDTELICQFTMEIKH